MKLAQWIKALAINDLCSIPGTHMVEGKNLLLGTMVCACVHTLHIHNK